jgi:hypothetical protein
MHELFYLFSFGKSYNDVYLCLFLYCIVCVYEASVVIPKQMIRNAFGISTSYNNILCLDILTFVVVNHLSNNGLRSIKNNTFQNFIVLYYIYIVYSITKHGVNNSLIV